MAAEEHKSVIFIDMDRTLLEGPFISVVFPWIIGEIARKTGQDFAALLRQMRQENARRLSDPAFDPVLAMDWDDIFAAVAGQLGVRLDASAVELVRSHPGPPFTTLNRGAHEALRQLSAGRPERALVLATKGLRKYQIPVLEACGLLPYFDEILTPDASQAVKQSPAFYGAWPAKTRLQVMVGDLYEDDVLPAHQFGFKTVLCAWDLAGGPLDPDPFARARDHLDLLRDRPVRPDAVITSLYELPRVIKQIEYESLRQ